MADSESVSFGEVIRHAREEKKITLRKFAEMAGLSATYVSMVERNEQDPPAEETIIRIANLLGLDPDYLLGLGQKISSDLKHVITERPRIMAQFLRTAEKMSDEDIEKLLKKMNRKTP